MKLLDRFHRWRAFRRAQRHIKWLRKARVVLTAPNPRCVVRNPPGIVWHAGEGRER